MVVPPPPRAIPPRRPTRREYVPGTTRPRFPVIPRPSLSPSWKAMGTPGRSVGSRVNDTLEPEQWGGPNLTARPHRVTLFRPRWFAGRQRSPHRDGQEAGGESPPCLRATPARRSARPVASGTPTVPFRPRNATGIGNPSGTQNRHPREPPRPKTRCPPTGEEAVLRRSRGNPSSSSCATGASLPVPAYRTDGPEDHRTPGHATEG